MKKSIILVSFAASSKCLFMLISIFTKIIQNPWTAVLWTILIITVCNMPSDDVPEVSIPGLDKAVHAGIFGVWTVLWLSAYPSKAIVIIISGILFGIGIEICQQLLPFHRTFDWLDAAADTVGILLGLGFKTLILDRYLHRLY